MEFEAKIKQLEKEIVNVEKITDKMQDDLLTLPAPQLTINDVKVVDEFGTFFNNLHDFIKQTIVDACATSYKIDDDVDDKIVLALETKTGK